MANVSTYIAARSTPGPQVLQQYIDAFNVSCLPWVPEKGTVGASGDLAPLSHLALGMMGEGKMWSPQVPHQCVALEYSILTIYGIVIFPLMIQKDFISCGEVLVW